MNRDYDALRAIHLATLEENERLRAALEAVEEWSGPRLQRFCPFCRESKVDGHAPDCQRQLALRAGGGET